MLPGNTLRLEVRNHILNPAEAEVWFTVRPVEPSADVELQGRLMGPRCPYATTVEVAYPFRPLPGPLTKPGEYTARAIVPEPSFWDPESPFLYLGSVEVRQGGRLCFRAEINHGLRVLQLGTRGLFWNGRALAIRGIERRQLSADDALQLRRQGYNTVLCPVSAETEPVWDAADRFGFLVLGRLSAPEPDAPASNAGWLGSLHQAVSKAEVLQDRVSCLGWLIPHEIPGDGAEAEAELTGLLGGRGQLLGVELDRYPPDRQLSGIDFIFAKEELLPLSESLDRPLLLKSSLRSGTGLGGEPARTQATILGFVLE